MLIRMEGTLRQQECESRARGAGRSQEQPLPQQHQGWGGASDCVEYPHLLQQQWCNAAPGSTDSHMPPFHMPPPLRPIGPHSTTNQVSSILFASEAAADASAQAKGGHEQQGREHTGPELTSVRSRGNQSSRLGPAGQHATAVPSRRDVADLQSRIGALLLHGGPSAKALHSHATAAAGTQAAVALPAGLASIASGGPMAADIAALRAQLQDMLHQLTLVEAKVGVPTCPRPRAPCRGSGA